MNQFRVQVSVLQTTGRWRRLAILLLALGMLFAARPAYCTDYFVAPDGNDSNDGTIDSPFGTIGHAEDLVVTGDTIYLRGGVHYYSTKIRLEKSGTSGNRITLQNYQNETVILDFSGMPRDGNSRGIQMSAGADYWHLKGFTIRYAGDNGLYTNSSYNIFEQLITHSNDDSGIQLTANNFGSPSYNQVINCDSYLNFDPANDGENADGFAAKGPTGGAYSLGPGNVFRGCRAWNNSDDGFDFWYAGNTVTVEDCWAFRNGEDLWDVGEDFDGDGNGFKLGHGGGAHVLIRCVAYENVVHGIDINGNETGVTVYNCTCVDNGGYDFYFDYSIGDHELRNNLSYLGGVWMDSGVDHQYNSWNGFTVSAADFASLTPTGIDGPREPDGGLPALQFLRLARGSSLIDGGINVGLAFDGTAPDLGAFERLDGDCEPDGDIDLDDLGCLAANWLDTDCGDCNGADFDGNSDVDLYDFAKMAANWLKY